MNRHCRQGCDSSRSPCGGVEIGASGARFRDEGGFRKHGDKINAQGNSDRRLGSGAFGEFEVAEEFFTFGAFKGFGGAGEFEVEKVELTPVGSAFEAGAAGTGGATCF